MNEFACPVDGFGSGQTGVMHADGDLHPVGRVEFGEDVRDVCLDGRQTHVEAFGDLGVGGTAGEFNGHVTLTLGQ